MVITMYVHVSLTKVTDTNVATNLHASLPHPLLCLYCAYTAKLDSTALMAHLLPAESLLGPTYRCVSEFTLFLTD